jgi:diadenosine tetraphosphate (Ap4A) HIT family hydrolase
MAFALHPQLAADSHDVGNTQHCMIRLVRDSRFLWLLAVPRYADCREWHALPTDVAMQVFKDVSALAAWAGAYSNADKMNIAALGNQVPQLHIHVVARHIGDAAWPNPIWGSGPMQPYAEQKSAEIITRLQAALALTS